MDKTAEYKERIYKLASNKLNLGTDIIPGDDYWLEADNEEGYRPHTKEEEEAFDRYITSHPKYEAAVKELEKYPEEERMKLVDPHSKFRKGLTLAALGAGALGGTALGALAGVRSGKSTAGRIVKGIGGGIVGLNVGGMAGGLLGGSIGLKAMGMDSAYRDKMMPQPNYDAVHDDAKEHLLDYMREHNKQFAKEHPDKSFFFPGGKGADKKASECKEQIYKFAADISSAARKSMPEGEFALPSRRMFPMPDKAHVRLAWQFVNRAKISDGEKAQARSAIKSKAKSMGIDTASWKE